MAFIVVNLSHLIWINSKNLQIKLSCRRWTSAWCPWLVKKTIIVVMCSNNKTFYTKLISTCSMIWIWNNMNVTCKTTFHRSNYTNINNNKEWMKSVQGALTDLYQSGMQTCQMMTNKCQSKNNNNIHLITIKLSTIFLQVKNHKCLSYQELKINTNPLQMINIQILTQTKQTRKDLFFLLKWGIILLIMIMINHLLEGITLVWNTTMIIIKVHLSTRMIIMMEVWLCNQEAWIFSTITSVPASI